MADKRIMTPEEKALLQARHRQEVVDDSKNGYLIPAKNSEKIAEKVLYLFEHPETQKQLEREAYRTFQNEFSFEKFS